LSQLKQSLLSRRSFISIGDNLGMVGVDGGGRPVIVGLVDTTLFSLKLELDHF